MEELEKLLKQINDLSQDMHLVGCVDEINTFVTVKNLIKKRIEEIKEENQRYRVFLPQTDKDFTYYLNGWGDIIGDTSDTLKDPSLLEHVPTLTKKQIEAIDPRYMAFAEKVEVNHERN